METTPNNQSAIERINLFQEYYIARTTEIELELQILSEALEIEKNIDKGLRIKLNIEKHLEGKRELDSCATFFYISLKPLKQIKYVNTQDQGGDNSFQSESKAGRGENKST